jgi:hypothetical protein
LEARVNISHNPNYTRTPLEEYKFLHPYDNLPLDHSSKHNKVLKAEFLPASRKK